MRSWSERSQARDWTAVFALVTLALVSDLWLQSQGVASQQSTQFAMVIFITAVLWSLTPEIADLMGKIHRAVAGTTQGTEAEK